MGDARSSLMKEEYQGDLERVAFFSFATYPQPIIGTTVAAWEWAVPIWLQIPRLYGVTSLGIQTLQQDGGSLCRCLFLTNKTTRSFVFCLVTAFY